MIYIYSILGMILFYWTEKYILLRKRIVKIPLEGDI